MHNADSASLNRVLSLGAGVQSSTLLLMSAMGELPKLDLAVFADTQWEPKGVYEWLVELRRIAEGAGIPLVTVTQGDLRADTLRGVTRAGSHPASLPVFVLGPDRRIGRIKRQCTRTYKIEPVRRAVRSFFGLSVHGPAPRGFACEMWLGISADEASRAKPSNVAWLAHRFPLLSDVSVNGRGLFADAFTRGDCLEWLRVRGYRVPRSACCACPFRSDTEWADMTTADPAAFVDAVAADRAIRDSGGTRGKLFVHRSCVPLDQVRFAVDAGARPMVEECEGMCGL